MRSVATESQLIRAINVVTATTRLMATFAAFQGLFIILGHKERWGSPALKTALQFPGAPESWGAVLMVCGLMALAGSLTRRWWLIRAGMLGIAIWCFFFASTFVYTAITDHRAGTTGILTYVVIGLFCCLMAVAYKRTP
jgi:hypothetical protein